MSWQEGKQAAGRPCLPRSPSPFTLVVQRKERCINPHLHVPLTVHHLTFHCRAQEPILWHPFKGSAVRGAFAGVLRRTFCPEGARFFSRRERGQTARVSLPRLPAVVDAAGGGMPTATCADPYAVRPPARQPYPLRCRRAVRLYRHPFRATTWAICLTWPWAQKAWGRAALAAKMTEEVAAASLSRRSHLPTR